MKKTLCKFFLEHLALIQQYHKMFFHRVLKLLKVVRPVIEKCANHHLKVV